MNYYYYYINNSKPHIHRKSDETHYFLRLWIVLGYKDLFDCIRIGRANENVAKNVKLEHFSIFPVAANTEKNIEHLLKI